MNIEIIKSIFPTGTISYLNKSGFEVNGLDNDTMPLNCSILGQAVDYNFSDHRFYLVEANEYYIFLRVCKASKDSSYKEYAVGHSWVECGNEDSDQFLIEMTQKLATIKEQW